MRRARRAGLATTLALVVLVVGCSGGDEPDRKPSGKESTSAVSTASPSDTASGSADPAAPGEGPDPYWPQDGNAGTDALHYAIGVDYDFDNGMLVGDTTITMKATDDLEELSLDLLLPVKAVRVDGRPAKFDTSEKHEVLISPADPIAAGSRFKVRVTYAGVPGKVKYDGESSWLGDDHEVVTMGQPHMAAWWFPSNDHPGDKATFDIRVTVPKDKVVVSNGTQAKRTVKGAEATTRWRMTEPMATYLAFFAAGDFLVEKGTSAGGIPYTNAVSRRLSKAERTSSLRALRRTGEITDWLVERIGPYPFDSTGGVVTGLDVGFALENQTRPTYGSWIYPSVVVHELAHQWFGDSVSVRQWRDIWINEGFASYFEADYAAEHGGPSVTDWLHDRYDEECGTPDSAFWTLDLSDPGADDIFAQPVYDRGALVLGALRNRLGDDTFHELVRGWARDLEDGNASVADFEKRAAQASGEDLTEFFDAWLRDGTAPEGTEENGLDHACP